MQIRRNQTEYQFAEQENANGYKKKHTKDDYGKKNIGLNELLLYTIL